MSGCVTVTGPPRAICSREARDHAAGAAEHVAEAHEHELRPAALQTLADDLGKPLGRTHHVGRVDRLVGRHEHELLDLRADRRAREHPRAVGVVAHRLPRVGLLHQRHVLVRAGVEDDARPLAREHLVDQRRVLDVADDRCDRQLRERVGERHLDLVDRGLGDVEQHELRRTEARDLAAELGADRAAGAGDQHHAIAEPLGEPRAVEHDRIAPEQVVELDRADRRQRRAAADQLLVGRHRQRLEAVRRADLGDAPAHAVRGRRQRDDHLAHAVLLRPRGQARDRPQHPHVAQQPPVLRRVVVEQADHAPLPAARELAGEPRAGLARADDEHRLAQRGERAVEAVLLPDPVGEAVRPPSGR